jgi:hypothetical protein
MASKIKKNPKVEQELKTWTKSPLEEPMTFESAKLLEVPVTIGDEKFVLREMDEDRHIIYQAAQIRIFQFEQGEKEEERKIKLTEETPQLRSILVQLCLFRPIENGEGEVEELEEMSMSDVRQIKPAIIQKLFERAKEINNLGDKAEERSKNSLDATTDTSV